MAQYSPDSRSSTRYTAEELIKENNKYWVSHNERLKKYAWYRLYKKAPCIHQDIEELGNGRFVNFKNTKMKLLIGYYYFSVPLFKKKNGKLIYGPGIYYERTKKKK